LQSDRSDRSGLSPNERRPRGLTVPQIAPTLPSAFSAGSMSRNNELRGNKGFYRSIAVVQTAPSRKIPICRFP
jgi:hypothetical protein